MVNQLKIITMTRLALYDKHEGPSDRAANDYFRHDYIYRNNLGTRLAVGLGSIIVLVIYWLQAFFINEMDLFELNLQQYATDSLMFIVAVLAVYSLIGTIQGTRQYYLVQKRLSQYQAIVRQLERLEERSHRAYDDDIADADTAPIVAAPPAETRPPRPRTPLPGQTAPLVRTPTGYTRPPRPAPHGATKPLSPGPIPTTDRRLPRHGAPDATAPPRPAPPGYLRPHPSMAATHDKPPRPRPYTGTVPGSIPPTMAPSDATTLEHTKLEHTKIPRPPGKPAGS
ncbi:MAG: hypothetical protein FWC92_01660 [Defluviitaleaceae bacterium]|nr:hypothetical protein [Defluviitaleaceae bacterium]